jgi:hypothetical protein
MECDAWLVDEPQAARSRVAATAEINAEVRARLKENMTEETFQEK